MKKIMFNDKFLLTKEVLKGTKTMTRRLLKEHSYASAEELKTIMEEKIKY